MEEDPITELARKYWPKVRATARAARACVGVYVRRRPQGKEVAADAADEALVRKIYEENLGSGAPDRERIAVLEFSGYLERYLWPRFDPARSSRAHLVSIILVRHAAERCPLKGGGRAKSPGVSRAARGS